MSLNVFHGLAAEEGDYVIVGAKSRFGSSSYYYAQVHNNKAYAAKTISTTKGWKWLRVISTVLCVVDEKDISEDDKTLIELNMKSPSVQVENPGEVNVIQTRRDNAELARREREGR